MSKLLLKLAIFLCSIGLAEVAFAKPVNPAIPLAGVQGGGAITVFEENGRVYFSDYNKGQLHSVSVYGGENVTHYAGPLSPWVVLHRDGRIYSLDASTAGSINSIEDTAEGITVLSYPQNFNGFLGSNNSDLVTDGKYVYWAERGTYQGLEVTFTKVLRTPLIPQIGNAIDVYCGCSTDTLFSADLTGDVHLALEGTRLFVSEGPTGKIYRVDLSTGLTTPLATTSSSGLNNSIPLWVTKDALFALINEKNIVKIDKNTGSQRVAASATFIMSGKVQSDAGGIYWWEPDGIARILKRLDTATDIISTVTQTQFIELYDFHTDGSEVWWFARTSTAQVELQRALISSGTPVPVGKFDFTLMPAQIFSDNNYLYWLSQTAGLVKMSKTGGSPSTVTNEAGAVSAPAALTETHVIVRLWPSGVGKVPRAGQVQPTKEWTATFPSDPVDMTMDEDHLYWLVQNWNPNYASLMRKPLDGGEAVELGTMEGDGLHLFPYGDRVFVSEQTVTGGRLSSFPKSGGPQTVLVITDPARPVNIVVKNDLVYFNLECDIVEFCDVSGLKTYDLNTSVVTTLIPRTFPFRGLHIDDSYVYWTEYTSVSRLPRSGGTPQMLYSGTYNWGLAGDDNCLFWANGWQIMRMAKPGKQCPKPPTINTSTLPQGEIGMRYTASLNIDGGLPPYSTAIGRGFLPSGLTLDSDVITGVPNSAGNSSVTVSLTDAVGSTTTKSFKLAIVPGVSIPATNLKQAVAGKAYKGAIKVVGGKAPYTWRIVSGALPNGLQLASMSGNITGISSTRGSYTFSVRITDGLGATADRTYTIVVK